MKTKLINFRKSMNMTIGEMASAIGVSNSFYEKIEYGDRNPSYNFILMFKKTFPHADSDEIFFEN